MTIREVLLNIYNKKGMTIMSATDTFKFGFKSGQIAQLGFGVTDVERAIDIYISQFHIGPWRYIHRTSAKGGDIFRGVQNPPDEPVDKVLAMAWGGTYFVELIQQFSGEPSCVKEHGDYYGYGLNHYGYFFKPGGEYDRKLAELESFGYEAVFSGITPFGSRSTYMGPKTREDMDILAYNFGVGYIEAVELVPEDEDMWYGLYEAARNWDGKTRMFAE